MPTRVVLKGSVEETSPGRRRSPPRRNAPAGVLLSPHRHGSSTTTLNNDVHQVIASSSSSNNRRSPAASPSRVSHRSTVRGFRSSILRELAVRHDDDDDDGDREDDDDSISEGELVPLSADDIQASPRLLGYLFGMIASFVMLVSVLQFYRQDVLGVSGILSSASGGKITSDMGEAIETQGFFVTPTGLVYKWKLWSSMGMAGGGCFLFLITLLVHFDTFLFPNFWIKIFRDGSKYELVWILFLVFYWACAVHVSTSSLSVGELQANVYFTTWIAFAATAANYSVWRESAGLSAMVNGKKGYCRETTYNWLWTAVFSAILAGAVTDIYYNRDQIPLRLRGQVLNLDRQDWIIVLSVIWAEFTVCLLAIVFNEKFQLFQDSWAFPCRCHRRSGTYQCVFGWRQLEGWIILLSIGGKLWIILVYTGVDGVVNGLSNAYFGVMGSFFNSVFAFGTWLKENKNIEYIVREDDGASSVED